MPRRIDVSDALIKLVQREAITSLSQFFSTLPKGQVPLSAAGGGEAGGIQVIIHNNTSALVTAEQSFGGLNQKQLEITIDQMVASSLTRGRQTSSVLNTLFGLAPSLIGR